MTSNLNGSLRSRHFLYVMHMVKGEVLYRVRARSKVPNWLLTCNKLLTEEWPMF